MASGDVIWEATGTRLSANDWTRTDSNHGAQTAAFNNLTVTTPSGGGHTYTASSASLVLASTNSTQNVFGLVPFDTDKQYTITITEE